MNSIMRPLLLASAFIGLLGLPPAAAGMPEPVVDGLAFPEGPLFVDGKLHWVEYGSNRLLRLDGTSKTTLHEKAGCGHNGLGLTPDNLLVVVCYESHELIYLTLDGSIVETIDSDLNGVRFNNPNDIAFDAKGGTYISTSGPFVAEPKIEGRVYYRAPDAKAFQLVADDIHYGNGIALSAGGETLYVAEHNTDRVLKFSVADDGTLSDRSVFLRLADLFPPPEQSSIWLGPDGMKVDSKGNVYIAQYLGSRVLKVAPDGTLLRTYDVPAVGTTNVAFGETESTLYVTGAVDVSAAPWPGKIFRIDMD